MKRPFLLTTFFFLIMIGCEKDSDLSKTIDLEQFKIEVQEDWKHTPQKGIDSKVGVLSNGEDELTFDYGWYSYNLDKETSGTHTRTNKKIDGKDALIVQPKKEGDGVMGVYIEVNEQIGFVLYGENIKDEETAMKIFHSVKFEE